MKVQLAVDQLSGMWAFRHDSVLRSVPLTNASSPFGSGSGQFARGSRGTSRVSTVALNVPGHGKP